mgnify:FL=1
MLFCLNGVPMKLDNRIKFRHLTCFLEIARQRSFARAADQLAITQPAISKTLRELEELLGQRLFERNNTGVALTAAGDVFLQYAGPSVNALREGMQAVQGLQPKAQEVRIGALSTVESDFLPEVLLRAHQRYPDLLVHVIDGSSSYLLSQLKIGELDWVIGRMTDSPEIQGLSFEHLYKESLRVVVRAGHPLLGDLSAALAQLNHYPWVLPLAGTTIRQHADSLFVQWGITPSTQRIETLSVVLSRRYTLESQAIWLAPQDAVERDLSSGVLCELSAELRESGGSVGLCRNGAVELPIAATWLANVARNVAAERLAGTR